MRRSDFSPPRLRELRLLSRQAGAARRRELISSRMLKIAVDAMGGDRAPDAVVEGALLAAGDLDIEVVLVGRKEAIEPKLTRRSLAGAIRVVNASEAVAMDESPSAAIRRRDSSL